MDSAGLPNLILAGRSAACALFGLLACLLWRDRRGSAVGRLSVILVAGAALHQIAYVPEFQQSTVILKFPILALAWGSPAIFWLWSWAAFGDSSKLRLVHTVPWLVLVGGWSFVAYAGLRFVWTVHALDLLLPLLALGLAVAAAVHILITWRGDLVADRRSLRLIVLLGITVDIAVSSFADLTPQFELPGHRTREMIDTFAQCALAVLASWYLLRVDRNDPSVALFPANAEAIGDDPPAVPSLAAAAWNDNPALLHHLEQVMSVDRAYRKEGLTIGALAVRLQMPEYRLRQAINEGLGHRNFNAFLNRYRIEDAKAALSSASQADVPILTIAMDAGFQSIGPFNRAFKADTGVTPTEYRRSCQAKQLAMPLKSQVDSKASKTA